MFGSTSVAARIDFGRVEIDSDLFGFLKVELIMPPEFIFF
jgi:hypothetical protein